MDSVGTESKHIDINGLPLHYLDWGNSGNRHWNDFFAFFPARTVTSV